MHGRGANADMFQLTGHRMQDAVVAKPLLHQDRLSQCEVVRVVVQVDLVGQRVGTHVHKPRRLPDAIRRAVCGVVCSGDHVVPAEHVGRGLVGAIADRACD
ncbi:hypothetical protein D3C87_1499670 [compost metagenome]